jgi:hypothetical protein
VVRIRTVPAVGAGAAPIGHSPVIPTQIAMAMMRCLPVLCITLGPLVSAARA